MEIEQLEVIDFLKNTPPIEGLATEKINILVEHLQAGYKRKSTFFDMNAEYLYLIRTGIVEVFTSDNQLVNVFDDHQWFGYGDEIATYDHIAKEDTLFYLLPKKLVFEVLTNHENLHNFFLQNNLQNRTNNQKNSSVSLLDNAVISMSRANDAHLVEENTSIFDVAKIMRDKNITSVMVVSGDKLCGIITDRAFCTKVVATDTNTNNPISSIMTKDPLTIDYYKSGVEAMAIMANARIRHLPIIKRNKIVGVISAADLLRKQSHNVIFLTNEIHVAKNLDELVKISKQVPLVLASSIDNNLDERDVAFVVSSIGRSITQKLLSQAEEKFGKPPVEYAFVVAGSLARSEQIAHSDQDNLMILDDDYNEAQHSDYFKNIAKYVSDGLNNCGYIYCPGNVMATNDKWRTTSKKWNAYFTNWINSPKPKSLMYASIFFDVKCIHGNKYLLKNLVTEVFIKARKSKIFQSYMANNTLHYHPPIGFFRNFILDKNGDKQQVLDLKKRGVVPIIDVARTYALSCGVTSINTEARIRDLIECKCMSREAGTNLIHAYKFINSIRVKHQAGQIKQNISADNLVPIDKISSFDKKHLKDAFKIVLDMQQSMEQRYGTAIL